MSKEMIEKPTVSIPIEEKTIWIAYPTTYKSLTEALKNQDFMTWIGSAHYNRYLMAFKSKEEIPSYFLNQTQWRFNEISLKELSFQQAHFSNFKGIFLTLSNELKRPLSLIFSFAELEKRLNKKEPMMVLFYLPLDPNPPSPRSDFISLNASGKIVSTFV